ncbi:DUF2723 domain-containing protein [bacterium]|nr:DUF2723 domain-containing protein [bacterium]MBU2461387.1 DUF2723 domain-containing protein [bacterium]
MLALFLLLFSFLLYLLTLTPTVGLHDSGDMTTACWSMGICHPTGYPLYTIFGKLFITLIPIGSIAYRMNCLSAIFASLAVMMVYFIILKLISFQFAIRNPQSAILSSIVASLILAFSATFWEQAVIAEKYTLNAFFFSLLTFLLLKWQESIRNSQFAIRNLYLFSFILGLSFAHHFQTTYIIPGSIFFILATLWNHRATKAQRKKKSPQITQITQIFSIRNSQFAIRNLLLFLLPLFLWLYLPIAASFNPPLNWNNPQDLFGFINHITGFGYKALFSLPSITRLISQNLPRILSDQFSVSLIFSLLGVIFLFRKNLLFFIFLLPTICINIYLALGYNIPNIQDYYIPFFLYLSILIGCGLAFILSFIRIQRLSFLFLLLPLIPLYLHYPFCNRSKHYFVYDHTVSLLNTLSKNSVSFYTMDYNIFPLWYLLYVENRDERIMPILYPYFHQDWVLRTLNTIIPEAKIDPTLSRGKPYNELDEILRRRFDTLVTNNPNLSVYLDFKGAVPPSHILVPKGFVYYVAKADIDLGKFLDENPPIFRFRLIHDESIKKNWRIEMIIKEYSKGWKERGGFYSMLGRYKDGLYSYKKALELCENDPEIHKEMGRNYVLLEEYDAAMSSYNKALKLNPVYTDCFADLGVLYFKMGKQDMAISSLKEALSINPEHSEAKRNLSLLITKK